MHVRVCAWDKGDWRGWLQDLCVYTWEKGDRIGEWVYICAWAGWEQSRRKKWCVRGKVEGLCKLNYLVNW